MPVLSRITNLVRRDPFVAQALRDQDRAGYPYCKYGCMHCRSLCDCPVSGPTDQWVRARAEILRSNSPEPVPPDTPFTGPDFL